MTRTGQEAIDYARSRVGGTMPASGYCLQFVRQCFDVPSYYASAIDAWNGAQGRHPGDRNPPPAVPLYFLTPSQYDHVVFHAGGGECISTFNEDIRSFPSIGSIEANFDGTYLGWAEDINTVDIYTPEQEDDMQADERSWLQDIFNRVRSLGGTDPNQPLTIGDNFQVIASRTGQVPEIYDRIRGTDPSGDMLQVILQQTNAVLDEVRVQEAGQLSRDHSLFVLALVILISVVGGFAVGILADTQQGVVAGLAAIVGGLLATVLRHLPGRGSESE